MQIIELMTLESFLSIQKEKQVHLDLHVRPSSKINGKSFIHVRVKVKWYFLVWMEDLCPPVPTKFTCGSPNLLPLDDVVCGGGGFGRF